MRHREVAQTSQNHGRQAGLHRLHLISSPLDDQSSSAQALDEKQEQDLEAVQTASSARSSGPTLFKKRHEASSVELFFDLFFVANLTVFGLDHEVTSGKSLSDYAGAFTIIWFTWYQVTLFDARFSFDSLWDRVCKALHFGVMTGFAVVSTNFSVDHANPAALQSLCLIMMASRLLLVVQYSVVLFFTRRTRRTSIPLTLTIVILMISAAVFLGISFTFIVGKVGNGHDGLYIMSLVEAAVVVGISSRWSGFSFRHTCLPERVGLLTLIILGEGIIGFYRNLANVLNGVGVNVSTLIGMAICSVLITYFYFILYFDQVDPERFGTVRQSIWIIAHFPLNLAILFTLEGVNQLGLFTLAFQQQSNLNASLTRVISNSSLPAPSAVAVINSTISGIAASFRNVVPPPASFNETITDILTHNSVSSDNIQNLTSGIAVWIYTAYGYQDLTPDDEGLSDVLGIVGTAFLYLFIGAGVALITLAGLLLLGKRNLSRGEYGAVIVRAVAGLGLCLVSVMETDSGAGDLLSFLASRWILPTITLTLALVLFLDRIFMAYHPVHTHP